MEALAPRCHWISLGQLSKLIEILKQEGITEVVMCGQVKHAKIFSSIRPDWRLAKLLASLPFKNTDGLIGGVVQVLEDEGIHLRDSTALLKPLLAAEGAMTRRKPTKEEMADVEYGRRVANALAGFDVGQSVAICERAGVALEAMEGTDAMLRRAAGLVNGRRADAGESGAAPRASALRRAGGGPRHHPGDARNRNHGAGRGGGPHADARPRAR